MRSSVKLGIASIVLSLQYGWGFTHAVVSVTLSLNWIRI